MLRQFQNVKMTAYVLSTSTGALRSMQSEKSGMAPSRSKRKTFIESVIQMKYINQIYY